MANKNILILVNASKVGQGLTQWDSKHSKKTICTCKSRIFEQGVLQASERPIIPAMVTLYPPNFTIWRPPK